MRDLQASLLEQLPDAIDVLRRREGGRLVFRVLFDDEHDLVDDRALLHNDDTHLLEQVLLGEGPTLPVALALAVIGWQAVVARYPGIGRPGDPKPVRERVESDEDDDADLPDWVSGDESDGVTHAITYDF